MTRAFYRSNDAEQLNSWLEALGLDSDHVDQGAASMLRARRVRHCLEAMGPVFAGFGLYLSTRGDLLPADVCDELAELPDAAPASEYFDVRHVFRQELGCDPERAFAYFEPAPFETRLLWQAHRARLANTDVVVRIVHADAADRIAEGAALGLLSKPLSAWNRQPGVFDLAISDYKREIDGCCTFERDLRAAELIAQDAAEFDLVAAARLHRHLCTNRVLVEEYCDGLMANEAGAEIARTLCVVWLRQALHGQTWPVYPRSTGMIRRADGRIVLRCGPMIQLGESTRMQFEKYLSAVSAQDADESATRLCALYVREVSNAEQEEIRSRIRQMVPFREALDAGLDGGLPSRDLRFTNDVLLHWRVVSQVRPFQDPGVVAFFRGFSTLARTARQLAPGRDSLEEGFRDLRIVSAFGEMRKLMRPAQMAAMAETYAAAFFRVPAEAAELLRAGPADGPEGHPGNNGGRSTSDSSIVVASILLAFASVAVLIQKLESAKAGVLPNWAMPLLILAAGLCVLHVCRRPV